MALGRNVVLILLQAHSLLCEDRAIQGLDSKALKHCSRADLMPLDRRAFVGLLAGTPALRAQGPEVEVRIDLGQETATISPLIYGHFAEHIGRVIYEGAWVGVDSPIPNQGGLRLDTLQALKRLRPAVIRWPGGCFADTYHWEDGVGPVEDRPTRRNHWWQRDEPNSFGTAEYI